jgi:hypothetical protein
MFNLALDSKLRACDFIKLKVRDIAHGSTVQSRAMLVQQKIGTPVQFEITKKLELHCKNGSHLNRSALVIIYLEVE